jgi:ABC-type glycerol-3-phosphate transport system permease component
MGSGRQQSGRRGLRRPPEREGIRQVLPRARFAWPSETRCSSAAWLFARMNISTHLVNSVFVAVAVILGNIVFCSIVGDVQAKVDSWGGGSCCSWCSAS